MNACEANDPPISLYLDGELRDRELTEFESHLGDCQACQIAVAGRRSFLADLSGARPLYGAPPALRLRVESILAGASVRPVTGAPGARFLGIVHRCIPAFSGFQWTAPRAAFAAILLLAVAGGLWMERQLSRFPRSAFAAAALEAHKHRLQGRLPLQLRSSSPEAISAWFRENTPLHVSLPHNEDLPPQQQAYRIEGAGMAPFRGGPLGYIAYRVGNQPVSLLVAAGSAVTLAGRTHVSMKSLVIHYDEADGFHIVTWAVPRKGVAYALVSESSQHPNQSCIVCHASPKDQGFMRTLLSR